MTFLNDNTCLLSVENYKLMTLSLHTFLNSRGFIFSILSDNSHFVVLLALLLYLFAKTRAYYVILCFGGLPQVFQNANNDARAQENLRLEVMFAQGKICITQHNMTSLKKLLAACKNYLFGHTHQQIDAIMANTSAYLLQQHQICIF